MALYQYSWLILFAPLLSFLVIIFGTRMWDLASRPRAAVATNANHGHDDAHGHDAHGDEHDAHDHNDDDDPQVPALSMGAKVSGYAGIVIMLLACIYSWVLLLDSTGVLHFSGYTLTYGGLDIFNYSWGSANFLAPYEVRFHVDHLALAMLVVVTTISLLVQFYSQGYMGNSAGYARFFSYLSLFTFSMLVIVFAANFLVIFIGWELVGLSSYLLIGFWINKRAKPDEDRPQPATAAMQAFVVNRIGDVGFIIGIMILFWKTGTYSFTALSGNGSQSVAHAFAGDSTLLTIAMVLVFCGAIGKSAQVPLQIWLPNAMEGPTPVSALIHAATMVAAGVYMIARTFPLFVASGTTAFEVVAWIGAITALYAALTALTQTDFKRVLAYSTISQLGYMFVGLGVAGFYDPSLGAGPGMYHLFTHAFFKALLFLGAGSVIHSLHHATHKEVQDMRMMGGLAAFMPITAATFLVATLTISGFPFFAGFYSKDTIIGLSLKSGNYALYAITLGTAGLTAFYMFRAYIVAFGGKGGRFGGLWGNKEIYRGEGTPHEAPITITLPLILLAIASIFAGYWFGLFSYLTPGAENISLGELVNDPFTWVGVGVAAVGFSVAYGLYTRFSLAQISKVVEKNAVLRFLYHLTLHKFYVDDFYYWLTKYVFLGIAYVAAAFDTYIVDGIVNGVAGLVTGLGKGLRHTENGKVQSYMYGFFGGVAVLAIVVFVLVAFAQGGVTLW
jgi:NADH-quinone oxidoreductase subunit L